jgi:hypothetical protein
MDKNIFQGGYKMQNFPVLLSDTEAAKLARIHPQTSRNWRAANLGPPYLKIGRTVRYDKEAFINYLYSKVISPEDFSQ